MEIYRPRVTGRMEDRENKRKGTVSEAEMEKEMLATEKREGEQLDGHRERGKRKKKIAMSRRSEGQEKTGARIERQRARQKDTVK